LRLPTVADRRSAGRGLAEFLLAGAVAVGGDFGGSPAAQGVDQKKPATDEHG